MKPSEINNKLPIEADVLSEAIRLLDRAELEALELRLLGGAAIFLRTPKIGYDSLSRKLQDLDFFASRKHGPATADFLARNGYAADQNFNMMNGHKRLLFQDLTHGRQVDVFVGEFAMCHAIPLAERLCLEPQTVPLAELALTKLQIVMLNQKDLVDLCRLFLDHEVRQEDGEAINSLRIAKVCSSDWGLQRTLFQNLEKLLDNLATLGLSERDQAITRDRIRVLISDVSSSPKSFGWKARAMIGDRVQWYQEPEEV